LWGLAGERTLLYATPYSPIFDVNTRDWRDGPLMRARFARLTITPYAAGAIASLEVFKCNTAQPE